MHETRSFENDYEYFRKLELIVLRINAGLADAQTMRMEEYFKNRLKRYSEKMDSYLTPVITQELLIPNGISRATI